MDKKNKLRALHPRGLNHELNLQISIYGFIPHNLVSLLNAYSYQKSAKRNIATGVSRTFAASEMEFFVIIVYGFESLFSYRTPS